VQGRLLKPSYREEKGIEGPTRGELKRKKELKKKRGSKTPWRALERPLKPLGQSGTPRNPTRRREPGAGVEEVGGLAKREPFHRKRARGYEGAKDYPHPRAEGIERRRPSIDKKKVGGGGQRGRAKG